jgi:hypothetical protein
MIYRFGRGRFSALGAITAGLLILIGGCAGLDGAASSVTAAGPSNIPEQTDGPEGLRLFVEERYSPPENLRFIPAPLPDLSVPPGVGVVSRKAGERGALLTEEERAALEQSFRSGYREALLRGVPLAGVLGGDQVHEWPPESPLVWVQNWRSAEPRPNSWGLPALILSLRNFADPKIFALSGPILDSYGKSGGLNGANGAAGYGAPLGEPFSYEGGIAQRFDHGLMVIKPEGETVFVFPDDPPAARDAPPPAALPAGGQAADRIGEAFRAARELTVNAAPETAGYPPLVPDGPAERLGLEPVAPGRGGTGTITIRDVYAQSLDNASAVLILIDSPDLPFAARLLRSPYLEAFLAAEKVRLPGAEELEADTFKAGEGRFRALLPGLALYGVPLSDEIPLSGDELGGSVQRFSRGWMTARVMPHRKF